MKDVAPTRSTWCIDGNHARCSHVTSVGMSLWRPRTRGGATAWLCDCDCHAGCPLAGRRTVREDNWRQRCPCPGAVRNRQAEQQTKDRVEQRGREVAAVVAEASRWGPPPAEEIERRMRAVFEAHGERPPPLSAVSRMAAAATADPGTRTARLLGMGMQAVAGGVRWAWQPAGSDDHNRAEARQGYRSVGALAGIAATMTVVAARSTGRRRVLWASGAAVTGLVTGWAMTLITAVTQLARAAEQRGWPAAPPRDGGTSGDAGPDSG